MVRGMDLLVVAVALSQCPLTCLLPAQSRSSISQAGSARGRKLPVNGNHGSSLLFKNFFVASDGVRISPSISMRPEYPPPLANSQAIACPSLASFAHLDRLAGFCSIQYPPSSALNERKRSWPVRSAQVDMSVRVGGMGRR